MSEELSTKYPGHTGAYERLIDWHRGANAGDREAFLKDLVIVRDDEVVLLHGRVGIVSIDMEMERRSIAATTKNIHAVESLRRATGTWSAVLVVLTGVIGCLTVALTAGLILLTVGLVYFAAQPHH